MRKIFSLFLITLLPVFGHASLQVFPLRVVLSENQRNAQVSLRHKGTKPMKYRISTVFYQMGADGSMKALTKEQKSPESAEGFFRFSPRQVSLEPDIEQVVRLSLRMPSETPEGEYRIHLHFEEEEPSPENQTQNNSQETQLMLKAKMAVAIPIVVRKGNPQVKISFENLKLTKTQDQKNSFSVDMKKEGPAIAYGDIEIQSLNAKGEVKVIGQVNGLSSYVPIRNVSFPLNEAPQMPGKMKLIFKKPVSDGGEILATTETDLK